MAWYLLVPTAVALVIKFELMLDFSEVDKHLISCEVLTLAVVAILNFQYLKAQKIK